MAQHDYIIANDTAANVRSDINSALAAIVSQNSGASAPSTTYANMLWYDSTNNLLKMRDEADAAWITLGELDQSNGIFKPAVNVGSDATGDIYYRNASGVFTRLPIGTTDQVLTVASGLPSWADAVAPAGAGLEFIATADASNSSGLVFTGFDSASYDSYRFILGNLVPATDGRNLRISMSSNGGSSYTTFFDIAALVGSGAGEYGVSGELEIYFPHILRDTWVNATTMYEANDGNEATVTTRERWYAATWGAINTVRFNYSSGNVESGTVTMYGYKNA